jgi:hypothetical protein
MTLALAVLLDLAALLGTALLAAHLAPAAPWAAGLLAAALVLLAWGRWAAPHAPRRLRGARLAALKALAFGLGASGLFLAGQPWPAAALLLVSLCPPERAVGPARRPR